VFVASVIIVVIASTSVGDTVDSILHKAIDNRDIKGLVESEDFDELVLVIVVLSFVVNFIRQINHLLGQKVLLNYAAGKYHFPVEEELIFMFLDLKSSTTIAEKLGLIKNHRFLDDFFYDMTDPILESKCRIYQYVGDEIVFVWKIKEGIKNLNCINLFWDILDVIESRKDIYLEKYGVFPVFKAGLHCGKVITGEIGYVKKDIVYHGDTVNTASRIQAECNVYSKMLLISVELLKRLDMKNSQYEFESIGSILLRGKEEELELFSIERNKR
jgi:adenylate cyclase